MSEKVIAKFEIKRLQILDQHGKVDAKLEPKIPAKELLAMYRSMVFTRMFDEKCIKMQRQGRMGTYGPMHGQEASQVGTAYAAGSADWFIPSYRETAVYLSRGLPAHQLMLYWMGNEESMRIDPKLHLLPIAVPVGSQALHGAGIAMALRIQGKNAAALTYFGDGGSSEGAVLEALNFAGVFRAPCVFVNQNNEWAISVPREKQCACTTLAQKAIGAGFEGIQVDGNDLLAVYVATKRALDKARKGGGPTYIECLTYRMSMHTTADDPTRYQDPKVLAQWAKRDPIDRMRTYLEKKTLWDAKKEEQMRIEIGKEIEAEVVKAEQTPPPPPEDMFHYLYAEMPLRLQRQLAYLKRFYPENKGKQ